MGVDTAAFLCYNILMTWRRQVTSAAKRLSTVGGLSAAQQLPLRRRDCHRRWLTHPKGGFRPTPTTGGFLPHQNGGFRADPHCEVAHEFLYVIVILALYTIPMLKLGFHCTTRARLSQAKRPNKHEFFPALNTLFYKRNISGISCTAF